MYSCIINEKYVKNNIIIQNEENFSTKYNTKIEISIRNKLFYKYSFYQLQRYKKTDFKIRILINLT